MREHWKRYYGFLFVFILLSGTLKSQELKPTTPYYDQYIDDSVVTANWNPSLLVDFYEIQLASDSLFSSILYSQSSIFSNDVQLNLLSEGIYYWRVRSSFNSTFSNWSEVSKFIYFKPSSINDLFLWLKYDKGIIVDSQGKVMQWNDQSGFNHHATQADSLRRPDIQYPQAGIKPGVSFDNDFVHGLFSDSVANYDHSLFIISGSELNASQSLGGFFKQPYLIFRFYEILLRNDLTPHRQYTYYGDLLSHTAKYFFSPLANLSLLSSLVDYSGNIQNYINGNSVLNLSQNKLFKTIPEFVWGSRYQGTSSSLHFDGVISEIIFYNRKINPSEQLQIEGYLTSKYFPKVNLGPDIYRRYSFCNRALDAGPDFAKYEWSTGDTTRIIQLTTEGSYSIKATDFFGNYSYDTLMLVDAFQLTELTDTQFCYGDTFYTFQSNPSNYIINWSNGTSGNLFQSSSVGQYFAQYTDSLGCSYTDDFTLMVDSFQFHLDLGNDTTLCIHNKIDLQKGAELVNTYLWSNGSTDSTFEITSSGNISCIFTGINGCMAYDTIDISIKGVAPNADFSSNLACFGTPSQFTDQSSVQNPGDTLVSWRYIFNHTDTLLTQNPSYLFLNDSSYHSVTLRTGTQNECYTEKTKPAFVYPLPIVDFDPDTSCSKVSTNFTDLSISQYSSVNNWQWDFGSSQIIDTSSIQDPFFTYPDSGDYSVKLIVTSVAGCIDSISKSIHIKPSPIPYFGFSNVCEGIPIYFIDSTITWPNQSIINKIWDFGDGNTSSVSSPLHLYTSYGIYPTKLQVTANNGCTIDSTKEVRVYAKPVVSFSDTLLCINKEVNFTDQTQVPDSSLISFWNWSSNGNLFSTLPNPLYTPLDTGINSIKLSIETEFGCLDSITKKLNSYPVPTSSFELEPEYGLPPLVVNFKNNSINASSFSWEFGDGQSTIAINPIHTYQDTGLFHVALYAYNDYGCFDMSQKTVYAISTKVDAELTNLFLEQNQNTISLEADITNLGTQILRRLDVIARLSTGGMISEEWDGELLPGETQHYKFDAKFIIPEGIDPKFACIRVETHGSIEDHIPYNNEECHTFSNDFSLTELYPNPCTDRITVAFTIPSYDKVRAEIYNIDGILLYQSEINNVEKGFNSFQINTHEFRSGVYYLRLMYQGNITSSLFIKKAR